MRHEVDAPLAKMRRCYSPAMPVSRRLAVGLQVLAWLGLTLLRADAAASGQDAPRHSSGKPDVLLIIVDALNTHLAAYGNDALFTPNLERLARRGRRFDRAYNQFPICNPTRASLATVMRPWCATPTATSCAAAG